MPDAFEIIVRPCFQQDLEMVRLIYAHHVMTGTGTFETEPPSIEAMTERWGEIVSKSWPYLVASPRADLTRVLGFAYATQYRPRPGYSKTFEDSVYVAPGSERLGVGYQLLMNLIVTLKDDGARELLAFIGDSANAASIGVHAKAGFVHMGLLSNAGEKFGRYLDVVVMQRGLIYSTKPYSPVLATET